MEDCQLSPNFKLYELTRTDHTEFQDQNRQLTGGQIEKLRALADFLELVRGILGVPLIVHSGYRNLALNRRIGSKDTSQHVLCQAADMVPKGMDLQEAFRAIRQAAKDGKIAFGQLIWEKADRTYGPEWIHVSQGAPYRDASRCGQVLSMVDGVYDLIETIRSDQ